MKYTDRMDETLFDVLHNNSKHFHIHCMAGKQTAEMESSLKAYARHKPFYSNNKSRIINGDVCYVIVLRFLWNFYFKHPNKMLFLAHLLFLNETTDLTITSNPGIWLIKYIYCTDFFLSDE